MQSMVWIGKKADFKIQQMAFMIVFVFIFFILVGLFFLQVSMDKIRGSAEGQKEDQVMSALSSWSELPEFSCSDTSVSCLDEDKLYILGSERFNTLYNDFLPVASINVYKVVSGNGKKELIKCPAKNCNYYEVYSSGQTGVREYGSYVSICKKTRREGEVFSECELGRISIGIKRVGS